MAETPALRHSPLDAEHRALGARMAPFGGWEMPIQYTSVLEEHRACREHAVAFDVSHLGSVRVAGAGAYGLLEWAFTNDLARIEPGRAQYTHLLDPDDAHVVDDIIVWWVGDDEFLVMPNASNTAPLLAALDEASRRHADGACTIADVTTSRAVIAVQGPAARKELAALQARWADVPRFAVQTAVFDGEPGWVAGTGYTGEDGVELHVPAPVAPACWRAPARRRHPARRPRRPRHTAPGGRPSPPRARARPRHHAAAGGALMGRAFRQGRLPRPGAAAGRA